MNSVNFQTDVIEASHQRPIVADFWASWCAPCRVLGPVLEKLDAEANGRWRLVKVNTEENQQVATEYQIRSIPAVKMFSDGKVIAEFVGALPEQAILRWLDQHLPTESKKAVEEAKVLIEKGQKDKAQKILQYAIDEDAENLDAKVMLAKLKFDADPNEAIALVEDIDEAHSMFDQVDAMRVLYRLKQSAELDSKQNGPAWDAYRKGIAAYQKQDLATALEHWIDAVIFDKTIDNDGPRKACVSLFKLLGNEHELTLKYHRQFTSALF